MSLDDWVKRTTVFSNVAVVLATIALGVYSVRAADKMTGLTVDNDKKINAATTQIETKNNDISVIAQFAPLVVGTDPNAQAFALNAIIAVGIPDNLCAVVLNTMDGLQKDKEQVARAINECLPQKTLTADNLASYSGNKLTALTQGLDSDLAATVTALLRNTTISVTPTPQGEGLLAGTFNVFVASAITGAGANVLVDHYDGVAQKIPNFYDAGNWPEGKGMAFRCISAADRPGAEYGVAAAAGVPLDQADRALALLTKHGFTGFVAHTARSWNPKDSSTWTILGNCRFIVN